MMTQSLERQSAFASLLAEVAPPTALAEPRFDGALPQGLSPLVPPTGQPSPFASLALQVEQQPLPDGKTLWLEDVPAPAQAATLPQALWYAVFERHKDAILQNYRQLIDNDLNKQLQRTPGRHRPLTELELLLTMATTEVSAPDPQTGRIVSMVAGQLPRNLGVTYLRQWAQPQLLPSFVREVLEGNVFATGAAGFLDYLMMELAGGAHFLEISTTTGVPVYALLRFMRALTQDDAPLRARLQQAMDDGLDVATAAYAQMAADPMVPEETLDRAKSALVARRDLVLRLQESRFAPPAAARNGMRISAGGMQIDFTFDAQAPLPSTSFTRRDSPAVIDVPTKELPQ